MPTVYTFQSHLLITGFCQLVKNIYFEEQDAQFNTYTRQIE